MKLLSLFSFSAALLSLSACQTGPKTSETSDQIEHYRTLAPYSETLLTDTEDTLIQNEGISPTHMGYILYDPEKKEILREFNSDQAFIPASTHKLVSTYAALRILGPQYRFKTELSMTGKIHEKILNGDLYLKGSGDPLLTLSDLIGFIETLKKKGIQRIQGHFYFDENEFKSLEAIDLPRNSSASYNSGVSALSLEFNQLKVRWKPAMNPEVLQTYSVPSYPKLQFSLAAQESITSEPELLTYQPKDNLQKEHWLLSSQIKAIGVKNIPVKAPGYFTATLFKHLAELNGLVIPEPTPGNTPQGTVLIYCKTSLPLLELTEKILEYSNNLMAELITLRAAAQLTDLKIDQTEASYEIQKWIEKAIPKGNWKNFIFANGSGLGSRNQITPKQLTYLLENAMSYNFENKSFLSLLPISGWKGSLSERMIEPSAALRVWAKTGTQDFSSGLAGYLFSRSGRKLIFAILNTDYPSRGQLDKITGASPPKLTQKAGRWIKKIRYIQDQLVTKWIQDF